LIILIFFLFFQAQELGMALAILLVRTQRAQFF
jgi:peptidoglycan hydrolase-like protein with peptidoglycan-binding domain